MSTDQYTQEELEAMMGGAAAAAGIGMLVVAIICTIMGVLIVAGLWKIFTKAGKPGVAAIVPIWNYVVMVEMIGKPMWWVIMLIVPCTAIVWVWMFYIELAKCFGKSAGFGVCMVFFPFICIPILGFGSAQYQRPETALNEAGGGDPVE